MRKERSWHVADDEALAEHQAERKPRGKIRLLVANTLKGSVVAPLLACNPKGGYYPDTESTSATETSTTGTDTGANTSTTSGADGTSSGGDTTAATETGPATDTGATDSGGTGGTDSGSTDSGGTDSGDSGSGGTTGGGAAAPADKQVATQTKADRRAAKKLRSDAEPR